MKSFDLSLRAEASLDAIAAYSRETYGRTRGEAYIATIMDRCRKIALGHLAGRSCRSQFGDDMRDDLRCVQSGSLYVIFVDTPTSATIIDFIHQSADIGGRLGGPDE